MILCVTLNPCVDRTLFVRKLEFDKIISAERSKCIPGGKGNNVARVLTTFGLAADPFILAGGHSGRMVEDMVREQDRLTPIVFWTQAPTREVVTVVEVGSHRQVAFKEPGGALTPPEQRGLQTMLRMLMAQYEWVIFSGSVPCAPLDGIYFDLTCALRQYQGRAVLDSSGEALRRGLQAAPYLVKANIEEAAAALGEPPATESDIWRAAQRLLESSPSDPSPTDRIVALTAGRNGAYVICGRERWRAFPPQIQTVNAVGSGDSFLAGLVAGLVQKEPLETALRMAVAAGAANAAVWDAATFAIEDVERLLPLVRIVKCP